MERYLRKAKELPSQFKDYIVHKVPRSENLNADALARLASAYETEVPRSVPVEMLSEPSIERAELMDIEPPTPMSMDPIKEYLNGKVPKD